MWPSSTLYCLMFNGFWETLREIATHIEKNCGRTCWERRVRGKWEKFWELSEKSWERSRRWMREVVRRKWESFEREEWKIMRGKWENIGRKCEREVRNVLRERGGKLWEKRERNWQREVIRVVREKWVKLR